MVLATDIHGKWVRINVIHDVGANNVRTYVNGQLKATGDGGEAPEVVPQVRLLRHAADPVGQGRVAQRQALPRRDEPAGRRAC